MHEKRHVAFDHIGEIADECICYARKTFRKPHFTPTLRIELETASEGDYRAIYYLLYADKSSPEFWTYLGTGNEKLENVQEKEERLLFEVNTLVKSLEETGGICYKFLISDPRTKTVGRTIEPFFDVRIVHKS